MSGRVDLGYFNGDHAAWGLEKDFEDYELESRHFPSKVGGAPAWLDLASLPSAKQRGCRVCGDVTRFLLQIYAPEERVPGAFHRTIFVFICDNKTCWNSAGSPADCPVLVLRSQLARENRFYPTEPPEERADWRTDISAATYVSLCPVCGCKADKMCGKCRSVSYCCQHHQRMDWKQGHKQECREGGTYGGPFASSGFLEGLLEIEEEPEKGEVEGVGDFSALVSPGLECEDTRDLDPQEWEEVEETQTADKASEKFNERVRRAPKQLVRYDRHGQPLLCTYSTPLGAPTPCSCGAPRTFEFQIMPQVLSLVGLGCELEGGVDWGSLYVYTCSTSCTEEGYAPEEARILHFDRSNLPL